MIRIVFAACVALLALAAPAAAQDDPSASSFVRAEIEAMETPALAQMLLPDHAGDVVGSLVEPEDTGLRVSLTGAPLPTGERGLCAAMRWEVSLVPVDDDTDAQLRVIARTATRYFRVVDPEADACNGLSPLISADGAGYFTVAIGENDDPSAAQVMRALGALAAAQTRLVQGVSSDMVTVDCLDQTSRPIAGWCDAARTGIAALPLSQLWGLGLKRCGDGVRWCLNPVYTLARQRGGMMVYAWIAYYLTGSDPIEGDTGWNLASVSIARTTLGD
ncbi:hypothetical protein [Sphingosinithalassobacter portus]|uniref:hypothetical protein n=1 Tax=Stakelama portus TaxID=2676234 RepID=UPI000D6E8CE8|nr:hypothetical protein [Sphingosinithalassobacter portus]